MPDDNITFDRFASVDADKYGVFSTANITVISGP